MVVRPSFYHTFLSTYLFCCPNLCSATTLCSINNNMIWPTSMMQHHVRDSINQFQTFFYLNLPILAFIHLPQFLVHLTSTKHGEPYGYISPRLAGVWRWFKYVTWSTSSWSLKKYKMSWKEVCAWNYIDNALFYCCLLKLYSNGSYCSNSSNISAFFEPLINSKLIWDSCCLIV